MNLRQLRLAGFCLAKKVRVRGTFRGRWEEEKEKGRGRGSERAMKRR